MAAPTLLCFSNLDYGVLRYRKQHLMDRLAARVPVTYVNPPRAAKAGAILQRRRWSSPRPGLQVFEPPVLPGVRRYEILRSANERLIAGALRAAGATRRPLVLWLYSPHQWRFIERLRPDLVVYDVADLYATPSGARVRDDHERREIETLSRLEARLVPLAGVVTCVSEPLVAHVESLGGRAVLVPNGCDWTRYADLTPPRPNRARPTLGFVGTIAPRFDVDLVAGVARRRPDWRIELVGPVSPLVDVSSLRALPNVAFAGEVPYDAVPGLIAGYDVCLLPLRAIPFAYCSSPIQVYDYLAAGRPVVSTPVAQFEQQTHLVRTATDVQGFVDAVGCALDEGESGWETRRGFAKRSSWDERVAQIETLLRDRLGPAWPGARALPYAG